MNLIITCVTGMLLALAPLTGAATPADPDAAPIRVGTFNIRYLNTVDGPNLWEHRREHVRELIDFHEWELFGVQEATAAQMRDLEALDRHAWVGVGRDDGQEAGEYTAIFYDRQRFEVLDSGTFWLSATPDRPSRGWDARAHRICTWARLRDQTSGTVFTFFNTHLEHQGERARVEGARLLVRKIDEIAPEGGPVIVVGDFNAAPDEEPYRVMTARLRDARRISATPPYGPSGTFNAFDPTVPVERLIDFIFVSEGVTVRRHAHLADQRDGRYPSDHLPVMAKLSLPRQ